MGAARGCLGEGITAIVVFTPLGCPVPFLQGRARSHVLRPTPKKEELKIKL